MGNVCDEWAKAKVCSAAVVGVDGDIGHCAWVIVADFDFADFFDEIEFLALGHWVSISLLIACGNLNVILPHKR